MSGEKASEMRGEQSPDDTDLELDRLRGIVTRVRQLASALRQPAQCEVPHCAVCLSRAVIASELAKAVGS